MSVDIDSSWRERAAQLARTLVERRVLRTPAWRSALEETPRHVFVSTGEEGSSGRWLDEVYSDSTLVVQRRACADGDGSDAEVPTSSSTLPSLMIRMLEALDVRDGHRVLEIGTGTGYNAALVSHRLGAASVVSIDIDPELVDIARARLAAVGHAPTLIAGDGAAGAAEHGPYDRIIATCAVPAVPISWVRQLAPRGAMLVNVRGDLAGVLCLLTKTDHDDEVVGSVLPFRGDFMWLREVVDSPWRTTAAEVTRIGARNVTRSVTSLAPQTVREGGHDFEWMLQLAIPGIRHLAAAEIFDPLSRVHRPGLLLHAEDGSHAEVFDDPESDGSHRVVHGGPRRLWDTVEFAWNAWTRLARPAPQRFGLVANPTAQFVWLDSDTGWSRWRLPLVVERPDRQ